jgi:hypothetical protein
MNISVVIPDLAARPLAPARSGYATDAALI